MISFLFLIFRYSGIPVFRDSGGVGIPAFRHPGIPPFADIPPQR
jgi:hypothetical protein